MARLASQAKGGYYATPPDQLQLWCNRLEVEFGKKVILFDPAAGTGAALKQIAESLFIVGSDTETFAVELEFERAEEAKKVCDHVIKGGCESIRMSNLTVSLMYLNPPYDNRGSEKATAWFLRLLTAPDKYLIEGGLLGFCIPQGELEDSAYLLANRFEGLKIHRFTDDAYPLFKQVIVTGYRRKARAGPEIKQIVEWLKNISNSGPEALPPLDADDEVVFNVPPAVKAVTLFRGSIFDPVEMVKDIESSQAWEAVDNLFLPPSARKTAVLKNPVLPLKPTHYGVAIAAGALNTNMGDFLMEGMTVKDKDTSTRVTEEGDEIITEVEKYKTMFNIFHKDYGVITVE